jgi:hypothetical protein
MAMWWRGRWWTRWNDAWWWWNESDSSWRPDDVQMEPVTQEDEDAEIEQAMKRLRVH